MVQLVSTKAILQPTSLTPHPTYIYIPSSTYPPPPLPPSPHTPSPTPSHLNCTFFMIGTLFSCYTATVSHNYGILQIQEGIRKFTARVSSVTSQACIPLGKDGRRRDRCVTDENAVKIVFQSKATAKFNTRKKKLTWR